MADLTPVELGTLWRQAGGDDGNIQTAVAIALAESSGNPDAIDNTARPDLPGYHPPTIGNLPEYSVGPWQINIVAHPNYTAAEMLDPLQNAKAAYAISGGGQLWGAWSTYGGGAVDAPFRRFVLPLSTFTEGPPAPSTGSGSGIHAHALGGWADLQHAVNGALPFAVHRGRDLINATRRVLAGAP